MLLLSRSETPFWAMVKSAAPVCMMASSLVRRLCVTTLNVTTASTPVATASEAKASRSFFTADVVPDQAGEAQPAPFAVSHQHNLSTTRPASAVVAHLLVEVPLRPYRAL